MEIGNLNLPAAQFNSKKASTPVGGGGGLYGAGNC